MDVVENNLERAIAAMKTGELASAKYRPITQIEFVMIEYKSG